MLQKSYKKSLLSFAATCNDPLLKEYQILTPMETISFGTMRITTCFYREFIVAGKLHLFLVAHECELIDCEILD